jgi:hypothetical protein
MVGNLLVSDKEARFSIEKVVKSFGGVKVYGTQDERDSSYDIFGQEDYVFYDGSILRLEGTSYLDVDSTKGDVAAAIRSLSGFQLAKIKMHCTINLPKRGMPYDPFE